MRVKWAALVSSAGILVGSASVSAQGPVTLSGAQLDGVLPTYQYDPSRYQLRVALDALAVTDPDRVRDALLTDDAEAMEAQRVPAEEPEVRCTPARRALLAIAGRSERPGEPASQQPTTSAAPLRQSANTGASRLAAASRDPTAIGGAASPAQAASAGAGRTQPAAIRNAGSSGRQAVSASAGRTQPAAIRNAGSSARQAVSGGSRPPAITGAGAGKRAPAAAVASRAPKIEVPIRTARSDSPSRSSGAGAVRAASAAMAADITARVRSQVSRTLSAVQGGAFRLR
jgi:hypothetical protein